MQKLSRREGGTRSEAQLCSTISLLIVMFHAPLRSLTTTSAPPPPPPPPPSSARSRRSVVFVYFPLFSVCLSALTALAFSVLI